MILAFLPTLNLFQSSALTPVIYASCTSSSFGLAASTFSCTTSSNTNDLILIIFTSHATTCPTISYSGLVQIAGVCQVSTNGVSASASYAYYENSTSSSTTVTLTTSSNVDGGFVAYDVENVLIEGLGYLTVSAQGVVCGCSATLSAFNTYQFGGFATWLNTNASASTWSMSSGFTSSASSVNAAQDSALQIGYATQNTIAGNISAGGHFPTYFAWTAILISLTPNNTPCVIYACSTVTYSTVTVNSWCLTNPNVCTNETSTVTWLYDATSTILTTTYCSTVGNGSQYCVTNTGTISKSVVYVDTSVSLVFSTVTTTTTATAVIAPTTNSLLYWFFGFVSLLIPPATLVGIRANQSGTTSGEDFIPLILIGLFVGSLLGLVLNVLPWEFLVAFGGILVLYVIRSRL